MVPGAPKRERIDDVTLRDFCDEALVVCPKCSGCARVARVNDGAPRAVLTCPSCGHAAESSLNVMTLGAPEDPFFGLPLWLQAPCCGDTLWAYNWRHLAFLRDLIGSKQRRTSSYQPSPQALAQKMPKWMLIAKNRDEVLRVLDSIRKERGTSS